MKKVSVFGRQNLPIIAVASVLLSIVFYQPLSTLFARYVWWQCDAGTLALVLDKTDATLAMNIGVYYFGDQPAIGTTVPRPYNLSLASSAFGKAIQINPSIQYARYLRARIEFVQGNYSAALTDLNTELSLFPEDKRPLYMRGLTYTYRNSLGDLALAEQDFRAFSAWTPQEWAGYNDLAFVLAKEKKYADAERVLKAGISNATGGATNPWLWDALGVMQLNLNQNGAALTSLLSAQTLAASLTDADWQRAYPGNDPSIAGSGVAAMKVGIAENLVSAYVASKK